MLAGINQRAYLRNMHTKWSVVGHQGNKGFGGSILVLGEIQGRVYPLANLWRWEVRKLVPNRKLIASGTAPNEETAKEIAESIM